MRDLKMIGYKLKYVLLPKMQEDKGKDFSIRLKKGFKTKSKKLIIIKKTIL